ncbi:MAG: hypothetical protein ACI308_01505 [Muribaculaceae bacterium]
MTKYDLNDKQVRLAMMQRYLEAETSVEEECALRQYYNEQEAEHGEAAFAAMLVAEEAALRAEHDAVQQIDVAFGRHRWRWLWAGAAAAVAVVVLALAMWLNHGADEVAADAVIAQRVEVQSCAAATAQADEPVAAVNNKENKTSLPSPRKRVVKAAQKRQPLPQTPVGPEMALGINEMLAAVNLDDAELVSCSIDMKGDGAVVTKTYAQGEQRAFLMTVNDDGTYMLIALN